MTVEKVFFCFRDVFFFYGIKLNSKHLNVFTRSFQLEFSVFLMVWLDFKAVVTTTLNKDLRLYKLVGPDYTAINSDNVQKR